MSKYKAEIDICGDDVCRCHQFRLYDDKKLIGETKHIPFGYSDFAIEDLMEQSKKILDKYNLKYDLSSYSLYDWIIEGEEVEVI